MTVIPVIGMVVAEIGGLLSNQSSQNTLNLTFNERFGFKIIRQRLMELGAPKT